MANAKEPRTGGSNDDHDDNTTTSNNNARSETDPAEASARGKLRDLGVLCGEKNTCPPDTELSTGRGVVLYRKHTEVTEALGGLAPHTAGLRVDTPFVVMNLAVRATRASDSVVERNA